MRGLMMDRPLLIQSLIRYAARYHADNEIVSRTLEGPLHRYTYADAEPRTKQLAKALMRLGVGLGDRVATIAWNTHRHFEAYYAISGIGAVCHTINPRLFTDQLAYLVNHARDKVLLLDLTFVPLAEKMAASWPGVGHYVVMTGRAQMPATSLPNVLCYEDIVAAETPELEWPEFDENTAAALCYTSGTTGNRTMSASRSRCGLSDRADVPCQCVGRHLCRSDGRREARLPWFAARCGEPAGAL